MGIEKHPFGLFLPENARILIMGSFPCGRDGKYGDWFYCGSGRNLLWPLLGEIFDLPVGTRSEMEFLLTKHQIAICDIYSSASRKKPGCIDADLHQTTFNKTEIDKAINSGIRKICCASKYVADRFLKAYPTLNIELIILPSPSPVASRAISRDSNYLKMKTAGIVNTTREYRKLIYANIFNPSLEI